MTHDPYLALRIPAFRRYLTGHVLAVLGQGMLAVAVGWELYERTRSTIVLGLVGLVQVVPLAVADPPGRPRGGCHRPPPGADRRRSHHRGAAAIVWSSPPGRRPDRVYYLLLALYGAGRTFQLPAKQSLLPNLVPLSSFQNAVAWNSGGWQAADVIGPAIGGWIIARTGSRCRRLRGGAGGGLVFAFLLIGVAAGPHHPASRKPSLDDLLEGIRFVRNSPILLAAMSLDLFAVLLGGVVALLPVFARDILHVGPTGLGWLRAAQSFGAV